MKLINYALILFLSLLSLTIAQDDDDFEFDDDDFEFDEDEFDLEGIDEFDLEDDDFDDLLEEFELQEEEGFEEGEPRAFGFGLALGATSPFGQNLKARFSNGLHLALKINSPYGFYFGPFEVIFGGEVSYSTMPHLEGAKNNPDELAYTIMNFLATAKTKILFLDVIGGFGIAPTSAPAGTGDKANATLMNVIVDANMQVVKVDPVSIDLKFRAQEILGVPGESVEGTSDLIGFSVVLNYNF